MQELINRNFKKHLMFFRGFANEVLVCHIGKDLKGLLQYKLPPILLFL